MTINHETSRRVHSRAAIFTPSIPAGASITHTQRTTTFAHTRVALMIGTTSRATPAHHSPPPFRSCLHVSVPASTTRSACSASTRCNAAPGPSSNGGNAAALRAAARPARRAAPGAPRHAAPRQPGGASTAAPATLTS